MQGWLDRDWACGQDRAARDEDISMTITFRQSRSSCRCRPLFRRRLGVHLQPDAHPHSAGGGHEEGGAVVPRGRCAGEEGDGVPLAGCSAIIWKSPGVQWDITGEDRGAPLAGQADVQEGQGPLRGRAFLRGQGEGCGGQGELGRAGRGGHGNCSRDARRAELRGKRGHTCGDQRHGQCQPDQRRSGHIAMRCGAAACEFVTRRLCH